MILVFVRRSPVATAGTSTVLSNGDVNGAFKGMSTEHSALLAVGVAHLKEELVDVGCFCNQRVLG